MAQTTIRIFVSSPSDVAEERILAHRVIDRLKAEHAHLVILDAIFWEHEPLVATQSFQEQIRPPSEADIFICILWSRLGTRLPMHVTGDKTKTGTEYEFEIAFRSRLKAGTPDLLVYRKTKEPVVSLKDRSVLLERLEQQDALNRFMDKWFKDERDGSLISAFHAFEDAGRFEELLEMHLRKMIERRLPQIEEALVSDAAPTWTEGSPFRGLKAFEFEHERIFFGRTRAVGGLLDALRRQAAAGRAFVLVLGMSGGGKSSLVRAGVLPFLIKPGVIEGVERWRRAVMRPSDVGGDPFLALAAALVRRDALPELGHDRSQIKNLAQALGRNPQKAGQIMAEAIDRIEAKKNQSGRPASRLILFVDQLEEIFTLERATPRVRKVFVAALASLARSQRIWVLAALRSDFYHRCEELPTLAALKEGAGQYHLLPPTPAEIGQMIRSPAWAAGLRFEEDPKTKEHLDDTLRDAASTDAKVLPLLEFALEELYERRTAGGVLTHQAYRELGGIEGSLARRAESVYAGLPAKVRGRFSSVFRALISVRQGEEDTVTRNYCPIEQVGDKPSARAFVDAFVKARLFVTDRREGQPVVTVAHEALLSHWKRLSDWIERDKEFLRIRARVTTAAEDWDIEGRPSDLLLPEGKPLADAEEALMSNRAGHLEPLVVEYIQASRQAVLDRYERQRRRSRFITGFIAVALGLALIFGAFSFMMFHKAREATRVAEEGWRKAELMRQTADNRTREAAQAKAGTEEELYFSSILLTWHHIENKRFDLARDALKKAPADKRDWEWGYLMNLCQTDPIVFEGHRIDMESAAFSPDGGLVATIDENGAAALWNAESGQKLVTLSGHTDEITGVAFSPDGGRVVTVSLDGTAKIWSTKNGRELVTLSGHNVPVKSAAFSRNGQFLATASEDGIARIWNVKTGRVIATVPGRTGWIWSAALSQDGKRIITAAGSQTTAILDAATGAEIITLEGHIKNLGSFTFSPDGRQVLTTSTNGKSTLWEARSGKKTTSLNGKFDEVRTAAFSSKHKRLLTASWENTAGIWNAVKGSKVSTLKGHKDLVFAADFSPDGKRIVTASWDKSARIWNTQTGKELVALTGHTDHVSAASFSPDGKLVITASGDGTARIWDASTGSEQFVFSGNDKPLTGACFSPDGQRILITSEDKTARILDPVANKELVILKGHQGGLSGAGFSPDGRRVVTASWDKTAKIWDAQTGRELITLVGHDKPLTDAGFSPDGREVITVAKDGTARIWLTVPWTR